MSYDVTPDPRPTRVERAPRESLLRRTPLRAFSAKRRRRRQVEQRLVAHLGFAFRESIVGLACVVCGRHEMEAVVETGYGHQAHHGLSKKALKKAGLGHLIWDVRNAVCVCEEPCHRRHTDGVAPIRFELLPVSVVRFAAEVGMSMRLEREYPRRWTEARELAKEIQQ